MSGCVFLGRSRKNDGVEIIANDQGNRTTPSYVAFTDTERLIGDAAKNQVARNPENTVPGRMREVDWENHTQYSLLRASSR